MINRRNDWWDGEEEILSWECSEVGVYYIKISNADSSVYGENTDYELTLYTPTAPIDTGVITGMITDKETGEGVDSATVTTDAGGLSKVAEGYYLMIHPAGTFAVTVRAADYQSSSAHVTLSGGDVYTKDFALVKDKPDPGVCPVAELYGDRGAKTKDMKAASVNHRHLLKRKVFSKRLPPFHLSCL